MLAHLTCSIRASLLAYILMKSFSAKGATGQKFKTVIVVHAHGTNDGAAVC
jgi:hypothetical protein